MLSTLPDTALPPAPERIRTYALVAGRAPMFTPLTIGMVGSYCAWYLALDAFGPEGALAKVCAVVVGVLGTALSAALLRRAIPDAVRLSDGSLELLRGERVVRRVNLAELKEVSEFQTPAKVLLVADARRHITLPSFALTEPRNYEEITSALVDALERIDPTGSVARGAVRNGRLRETISQQPVRGTLILAGVLVFASAMAFRGRLALAGTPFPDEALGALSAPLLQGGLKGGELFRVLSYVFVHVSWPHLLVCTVATLYIGTYLERLLGWERVVLGFVAGALGGAAGHLYLGTPLPAMGASSALFGLFGLLGAVALTKRRLPPTLLPHPGFWILSVFLALQLTVDAQIALALPFISPAAHIGGVVFGLLVGLLTVVGIDIPPPDRARRQLRPFAILASIALGIGLVGGVLLGRGHTADTEVITEALLALPRTQDAAEIQNNIAYLRLRDPRSTPETLDIATRLAAAAADNTDHQDPMVLDTLAVALYKQGHVEEARTLLNDALKINDSLKVPLPPVLVKDLKQHAEDMENGTALRPDPPHER